jgi:hypothetical protein
VLQPLIVGSSPGLNLFHCSGAALLRSANLLAQSERGRAEMLRDFATIAVGLFERPHRYLKFYETTLY